MTVAVKREFRMYADIKMMLLFTCISTPLISVGAVHHDGEVNAYIPEYILDILQNALNVVGPIATNKFLSNKLDEWKMSEINVGVIGNSGVGKSSFINAIRGLTADDDGAAEVGVVETTKKPKSYKHPNNDKLLLWDLPGIGTPTFTQIEYLDKIKAWMYDYFIIISSSRFTENDIWLAKELTRKNKKFYFVRSKISMDVENDRKSHPKTHDKKKLLSRIRYDCEKNLDKTGYIDDVYLIDTFERDAYDFPDLSYKLVSDAPALKRQTVLFTLNSFSEEMILIKKKALMERIHYIALAYAIVGAIPIADLVVDVDVGVKEANFYKQQFGLFDQDDIYVKLMLSGICSQYIAKGITYVTNLGVRKMAMFSSATISNYVLPGIGSTVNGAASYTYIYYTLKSLLDKTAQDALEIAESVHDNYD